MELFIPFWVRNYSIFTDRAKHLLEWLWKNGEELERKREELESLIDILGRISDFNSKSYHI
jgi:hypothetical protein